MELIYLSKKKEFEYAFQKKLIFSNQVKILTDSLIICEELDKLKIDYFNVWDYLSPEEIFANRTEANNLAQNFIDKKQKKEQLLLQSEAILPFEMCLNSISIIRKILSRFEITKISFFKNKKIAMLRTGPPPGTDSSESIFKAILCYCAGEKKIHMSEIENNNSKFNIYSANFFKRKFDRLSLLKLGQKNNLVIIYKTGMHIDEVNFLAKYITEKLELRVVILSEHILNFLKDLSFGIRDRKIGKLVILESLVSKMPEIFENIYLNFQFQAFEREVSNSIDNSSIFEQLVRVLNPSILVLGHDSFAKERAIINVSKNNYLKTISFIHGGVCFKFTQRNNYGDSDKFALWNPIDSLWFKSFGLPKNKILTIGSIRFEDYFKKHLWFHNKNAKDAKKPLIVILTANISIGLSTILANPKLHLESLKEFITIANRRTDIDFVFKCHPSYDYKDLYKSLFDIKSKNVYISSEINLDKILVKSDGVLLINYASSGVINSLLNFNEVIYYDRDVLRSDDWECTLDYTNILRSKSMKNVFALIDKIIKKKPKTESNELSKLLSYSDNPETLINTKLLDNFFLGPKKNTQILRKKKRVKNSVTHNKVISSFCNGLFIKSSKNNLFKIREFYSFKLGVLFSRSKKNSIVNLLTLSCLTIFLCKDNKSKAFILLNLLLFSF